MEKLKEDLLIPDEEIKSIDLSTCLNLNIGVMGHIDSGKTSLARALTKVTSTASLDKNPQSKERGITLDIGFSAFYTRFPTDRFPEAKMKYIQFTLVDCPGHASLIKTILGGASIIDLMFLVIDITKGIQTQTSECIVIGEILMPKIIVILNKCDLLPPENREETIKKKIEGFRKIMAKTKFGGDIPIVPISAALGAETEGKNHSGVDNLIQTLIEKIELPKRNKSGAFHYLIDHCFNIKGQGTVVTGTVIQGVISPGQEVEFPNLKLVKKVKSMQMFKKPAEKAMQGDRLAMLFTQLDASLIERGIACEPNYMSTVNYAIILAEKVPYYKGPIKSKSKFHITTGHQTVMGKITLFRLISGEKINIGVTQAPFKTNLANENPKFTFEENYEYVEEITKETVFPIFVFLELETPFLSHEGQTIIASKLDTDVEANVCRIAFYGKLLKGVEEKDKTELKNLKILRQKEKKGTADRILDAHNILVAGLFRKASDISSFIGKVVELAANNKKGKIVGTFGQSGKIKVQFESGLFDSSVPDDKEKCEKEILGSEIILRIDKSIFVRKFESN